MYTPVLQKDPLGCREVKKLTESQWGSEGLKLRTAPRKPGLATVLSPHLSRDFAAAGGEVKSFCCPFGFVWPTAQQSICGQAEGQPGWGLSWVRCS